MTRRGQPLHPANPFYKRGWIPKTFDKGNNMDVHQLISFLHQIENLKYNTRHSWTSGGRQESVAEHSWRLAVMAMLCADEYPEMDINKVIRMCLIHDFGEAITGDIPAFLKTEADENTETDAVHRLLSQLPEETRTELTAIFSEMQQLETQEAKLYKALDNMEGLLSHNEAALSTWLPLEYELNLTYGQKSADFSPWTQKLRETIRQESVEKIRSGM